MSLETIDKKLENIADISFWKFLLCFGIIPALGLLILYPIINPTVANTLNFETPILRIIAVMAFTAMFLILSFGTLTSGIIIIKFLIKLNQSVHENSGKFLGKSLSTNQEFLHDLARGLYYHLIELGKHDNDPRFEELEVRHQRERDELKIRIDKLEANEVDYNRIIAEQKRELFTERLARKEAQKQIDILLSKKSKTENNKENTEIIKSNQAEFLD